MDKENLNIQLVKDAIQALLIERNMDKYDDYFTQDAVMMINTTAMNGKDEISKRINWMKNNAPTPTVVIKKIFFRGDEGFDSHTTTIVKDGENITYKIFAYVIVKNNRIALFEDVTCQIEGKENLHQAESRE